MMRTSNISNGVIGILAIATGAAGLAIAAKADPNSIVCKPGERLCQNGRGGVNRLASVVIPHYLVPTPDNMGFDSPPDENGKFLPLWGVNIGEELKKFDFTPKAFRSGYMLSHKFRMQHFLPVMRKNGKILTIPSFDSDPKGRKSIDQLPYTLGYDRIIRQQKAAGGLSTIIGSLLSVKRTGKKIPQPGSDDLTIKWNRIKITHHPVLGSVRMEVVAVKEQKKIGKKFIYMWEIRIAPGEFRSRKVAGKWPFRHFARGKAIQVLTFMAGVGDNEKNLKHVRFINADGTLNPLARAYYHSNSDCLEIKSKKDLTVDGTIGGKGNKVEICGGSCSGYLLAATNA